MSWNPTILRLEIESIFFPLSGGYVIFRLQEAVHQKKQRASDAWSEHGRWYERTTKGRVQSAARHRARMARLRTVTIAVRGCLQCGGPFPVMAHKPHKRLCSPKCVQAAGVARIKELAAARHAAR
jgi:hypothetical protein